ncbi:hypothetical protein CPB86DRAFT_813835 [Serendipita vermifera]|nr:hypothetical protein CPB86DRAFT_813835 [Serendipita vermifera]
MSSNFREPSRDIEVQSPVQTPYLIEEKGPLSSDSSPRFRKNSALSLPANRVASTALDESKPPVRKYSNVWWESYWNNAIRVGQVPRLVYGGVGLLIVVAWILFTVLTAKDEVSWNKKQLIASQEYMDRNKENSWVALEGSLKNFDPIARTLNIEWSGLKIDVDHPEADPVPLVNTTGLDNTLPVEIYRETATTIWFPEPPYDSNVPNSLVYYRIANLPTPAIATIGWTEDDSFDTDISFKQAQDTSEITKLPLFAYPFDEELNCPAPEETIPAIMAHFSLTDSRNITEEQLGLIKLPCYLKLNLLATRPPIVKFAAILSVIVNWTSTLFIFILTSEVLIMRRGFMMSGTDLLGVVFTSLFALPSIRLLLPGAPDFGALMTLTNPFATVFFHHPLAVDLIGIIPNVIIISACVCAIAIGKLNRRKGDKSDDSD